MFAKKLDENHKTFVRDISVRPPAVVLYSDEQIKAYSLICKKKFVYSDATGSVVKRFTNERLSNLHFISTKSKQEGPGLLPVATTICSHHDAGTIC